MLKIKKLAKNNSYAQKNCKLFNTVKKILIKIQIKELVKRSFYRNWTFLCNFCLKL